MNKKDMIIYGRQFGAFFAAKGFYLQKRVNLSKGYEKIKWSDKLNEYRIEKLDEEFSEYIKQRAQDWRNRNLKRERKKIVWVFWWQGNQDKIPMVRMCLNSIERNLPKDAKMIIISKDNLDKYYKIPSEIMDKVNDGTISLTHLSDIVRVNLLAEWGGCWLDATVFAVRPFPYVFENEIWTTKRSDNTIYIPKGRWTGFAMSGESHNILFELMKDLFNEYWSRYNVLIDFFLIDLFIELLYRTVPEVKNLIDKIPYNNEHVQKLRPMLSEEYNEQDFKELIKSTDLYKLSWRIQVETMKNNYHTVYRKILSEYSEV